MRFWKKVLASVTVGVLCVSGVGLSGVESVQESVGTVLSASAYDGTYEGLHYNVTDTGEIEIAKCNKDAATVVNIPTEIDGKPVTSIGKHAFSGFSLTEITIPDSVAIIGEYAFYGCTSLTEITSPDSVTSIGDCSFWGCTSLTEITLPDSVTYIGYKAFLDTPWLKIKQAENPLVIVNHILIDGTTCTGSVSIPSGVTSIGVWAFDGCISLTEITIPDSVTSIGWYAFDECISLTKITIPDSVTSIGGRAFDGCISLTEITIPDSVTSIESTFEGCTSLTEITIPNSVTSIGYYTFSDCTRLTKITIPDSVTSIGGYAFKGCTSLTEITIPNSVVDIGESAFENCTNLTIYGYFGSAAETSAAENKISFVSIGGVQTTEPVATTTTELVTTTTISTSKATSTTARTVTPPSTAIKHQATATSENQTTTSSTSSESFSPIYGDINLDGQVDITDVILLNRYCSGTVSLNKNAVKNADCDGDKEVSSNDAVVLLQFLVHIVSFLPHSA